ncbi:glutathione peroxidase [Weeksella sp. HMSC059D05]|uniref:glutathione peroxidase n=2 Tax=Weeksella TaxID=1013 RepID=UPI0008A52A98|nr:glutathione peroxidase [Weeksella virosa]MDK7374970.1 glutathione peroxidase [Weeksella virosa]MDK7675992.1 glutathione peroxidase [Weeksella virosa]OFM81736.1 glutathione peroxidase [Weeksella sp. HMSC059D05]
MLKYGIIGLLSFSFLACNAQNKEISSPKKIENQMTRPTIYQYSFEDINGETFNFADLKGKKILIINTASKCGFTSQFETLEKIYKQYKDQNFVIVGFPSDNFLNQEYDDNKKIAEFCQLNYGVTFPMMSKSDVKGKNQNQIFSFLTQKELNGVEDAKVGWNFHKFLINEDGTLETNYPSKVTPDSKEIIGWIEKK